MTMIAPQFIIYLLVILFLPSFISAWNLSPNDNNFKTPRTRVAEHPPTSPRREWLHQTASVTATVTALTFGLLPGGKVVAASAAVPTLDVNNAMAREFTAFPGLYPTIATKIVNAAKEEAFTSKKQIYAILNEAEAERLKQYDASLLIAKPDKALQQFKGSQICKYECGSRTSNSYRDEQIKAVQAARSQ